MIQVVTTLPDIKVKNTDRIYFLHLIISLAQRDMFSDGLGNAIKNPFQIIKFTSVLYLDNNNLILTVTRLNIHTIEFIFGR